MKWDLDFVVHRDKGTTRVLISVPNWSSNSLRIFFFLFFFIFEGFTADLRCVPKLLAVYCNDRLHIATDVPVFFTTRWIIHVMIFIIIIFLNFNFFFSFTLCSYFCRQRLQPNICKAIGSKSHIPLVKYTRRFFYIYL